mgnify:FL=1
MKVTVELSEDEVLVALKRVEGYEDVHPDLLAEDAIGKNWPEYRTIHGDEIVTYNASLSGDGTKLK